MKYDKPLFRNDQDIEDCYINIYYHRKSDVLVGGNPIATRELAIRNTDMVRNSMMHGMKPTFYRIKVKKKREYYI